MPCSGSPSVGVFSKLIIEPGSSPYTFNSASERYEILPGGEGAETLRKHGRIVGGQGITGHLYPLKERARFGGYYVYGTFRLNPSPGYFQTLLPYLVGSHVGGGVFEPNDCPNPFGAMVWRDLDAWSLLDGKVDYWEIESRAPQFKETGEPDLLVLTVGAIFKTETWPASWPNPEPELPTGNEYAPYIIQDSDLNTTLVGAAREIMAFKLRYENNIKPLYVSSLSANALLPTGRKVTLETLHPWDSDHDDLYNQAFEGYAASLKFAYSDSGSGGATYSTQFDITNLKVPPESPFTRDRDEIPLYLRGTAYGDSTSKELTVTNTIP